MQIKQSTIFYIFIILFLIFEITIIYKIGSKNNKQLVCKYQNIQFNPEKID